MTPAETRAAVLVVDDEPFNRELLAAYLEEAHYQPVMAEDALAALALLEEAPERYAAVLLDRMMPRMDGLEVLRRMKARPELAEVPVIVQTAMAAREDVVEGLRAGAHYYLTKPFDRGALLAILDAAVSDLRQREGLRAALARSYDTLRLLRRGTFAFRTLDEGHALATLLAGTCPAPDRVVTGLSELFVNAIEHGNLGIGYREKSELTRDGRWLAEVQRRLALPEHAGKQVSVELTRDARQVHFTIRDQGAGFDWERYLDLSPERAFDTHGRGIAMARLLSFQRLEYRGNGSQAVAVVALTGP